MQSAQRRPMVSRRLGCTASPSPRAKLDLRRGRLRPRRLVARRGPGQFDRHDASKCSRHLTIDLCIMNESPTKVNRSDVAADLARMRALRPVACVPMVIRMLTIRNLDMSRWSTYSARNSRARCSARKPNRTKTRERRSGLWLAGNQPFNDPNSATCRCAGFDRGDPADAR